MKWDKNKIIHSLNVIKRMLLKVDSEELIIKLKYDYKTLLEVLKVVDFEAYKNFNVNFWGYESTIEELYQDFVRHSVEYLIDNKDMLFKLSVLSDNFIYYNPKKVFHNKIPQEIYFEMVRNFFNIFNSEQYELFEKLCDGNIHFTRSKNEFDTSSGRCYRTFLTQESFIITYFRRDNNIETLPHELAHSYELGKIRKFSHYLNWHFSSFCECYPRFVELAFLDYYIDSSYGKIFLERKYSLFDNLKISSENFSTFIPDMFDFDMKNNLIINSEGKSFSKKHIDLMISDFLAIYMFFLYKHNKNEYHKFMLEFHHQKGISDEGIWDLIDSERLREAFVEESKSLNKEIILSRKRIK